MLEGTRSKDGAALSLGLDLRRSLGRLFVLLVAIAGVASTFGLVARADEPVCRPPLVDRQRFGYATHAYNWHEVFDIERLRAGWYVDYSFTTSRPQGMDRTVVVKLRAPVTRAIIDPASVIPLIEANPGAIWLIGSEPDMPLEQHQDALFPEEYARLYHDLYILIKSRDRASRIAAGGILQPTPIRLQYLDKVLAAYQSRYGQPMPVDLWHIHNAILNEVSCEYDPSWCWGAGIPRGINTGHGEIRDIQDNDNMIMFKDQIWAFRRWMAENGYRGYPLLITEYGILQPRIYGFTEARVNAFMSATFDFLQTATDPYLGDPSDGQRLVQRWAWYWLDGYHYDQVTAPEGFNGFLFHQKTAEFTAFGQEYASHTATFPPLSYADLGLATLRVSPDSSLSELGPKSDRTLQVRAVSIGTAASAGTDLELSYSGPVDGVVRRTLSGLSPGKSEWFSFTLKDLEPGAYRVSVKVDPDGKVAESLECNNEAIMTLVVPTDRAYLPIVSGLGSIQSGTRYVSQSANVASRQPAPVVLGEADPGFQEFSVPTANSYPGQIALDPATGWVWITERDGNKIARYDPATGQWREYDEKDGLSPNSKPWGLAVDANGNVWFAAPAANRIGMLDVATGQIKEYEVPTPDSQPWDVAIGDDGSIWFTEQAADKIGRLNPATGEFIEYPLNEGAGPSGIDVFGNYVWFAETGADRIGWLNVTTGSKSGLQRPPGSQPQDVALAGPARIWWTEPGADRIVVFAPSTLNPILEINAPPGSAPFGIALEGQTAVWFTERSSDRLGRYIGGTVPWQYELPTPGSEPTGIAVDGAGCAWYAAPGSNQIGRYCRPPSNDVYLPLVSR